MDTKTAIHVKLQILPYHYIRFTLGRIDSETFRTGQMYFNNSNFYISDLSLFVHDIGNADIHKFSIISIVNRFVEVSQLFIGISYNYQV